LKKLCDAAKAKGIEVIAWYGPGHLWTRSPIFKAHPEYLLKGHGGQPPTTYCWPDITGVDLTGPWFDHAVQKLAGIRQRTGLGGFWLDSYINFTHGVKCATREMEIRQAESLARFHVAIQRLGYVTYTEASSDFGIKSNGFPVAGTAAPEPSWPAAEELADTSPYNGGWTENEEICVARGLAGEGRYFRYLANKCVPFIYWPRVAARADWQEALAGANHAYNAVVEFMETRELLPNDEGVQWTSADGKVKAIFAFKNLSAAVAGGMRAYSVPDLRPIDAAPEKRLSAKAGKVYLIRHE
jgi:hypothetical protein